jgi:hypothetical protein
MGGQHRSQASGDSVHAESWGPHASGNEPSNDQMSAILKILKNKRKKLKKVHWMEM